MQYRELGQTGLKVSEIGIGCEGLIDHNGVYMDDFLDTAERVGVNYIDFYAPNPVWRSRLGQALAGRRNKFILQVHLCAVWKNGQYERTRKIDEVRPSFEDMLRRLNIDSVEVGMVHYVDSLDDWRQVANGPIIRYAKELQAAGKIRHLGLSSHNPIVALEAVESGLIDVLMFSINPCYDLQPASEDCDDLWNGKSYEKSLLNMNPDREKLYEVCQRRGVGITVMKAFGGGDLLNAKLSPAGMALAPVQCLHYALTRPAVATVLAGAHTVEELEISVHYETASMEEKDYAAAFTSFPRINWKGHCMYCGHCAPCPKGIDVAMVTKLLNLAEAQEKIPETVREHYAILKHTAFECIDCGACEKRCPFHVSVRQNMMRAKEVFKK
ncbi:aldo/keto reductase [Pectinatus haikarae]|uniref:Aldo/keto reductase-like oxidoreductase n=1 Tax=Pectinatus haikarae TaxID=349096 RepID=A0ABT9YBV6_9FIRM|nr:aldo/keto reductase [Pectinatus haikarae]MDQ0205194.1 putative aldo/keto reductase-like oxidoreductase [Pectinatus haikarae]